MKQFGIGENSNNRKQHADPEQFHVRGNEHEEQKLIKQQFVLAGGKLPHRHVNSLPLILFP